MEDPSKPCAKWGYTRSPILGCAQQEMKKYYKYIILLLVVLGLAFSFIYFGKRVFKDLSHSPQPQAQEQKTTLTLNEESKTETFDLSAFVDKSALEATGSFAKIVASGTGTNAFITSINGKIADSKKKEFWELIINGKSAQVGAGSYIIQKGDSILWKITNF